MNYLWIDMEMSGLEVSQCRILEVAAIVTNEGFNALDTYEAIVYQEPAVLTAMDAWCTKQHGESGLTAAVASGKQEAIVEKELIAFVDKHFKPTERPILCGNSIGQDRKFIDAYMPDLAKRLHYRMVDVTSFKVILQDRIGEAFKKNDSHRALGDIEESIGELKHYLSFFAPPSK